MEQAEVAFELTCKDDPLWASLEYGSPELSVFFPEGADCEQLSYGQGEGQVLIDGHEWGFYYNKRGNIRVELHGGELSIRDAQEVVSRICAQLRRRMGVDVQFVLISPREAPPSSGV